MGLEEERACAVDHRVPRCFPYGGGVGRTGKAGTVLAAVAVALGADASAPSGDQAQCPLFQPGAERVPTGDCVSCHGLTQTHPVDLDYASSAAASRGALRSADEVIRRGVFLPGGQLKCVTCHDPRSPWQYKIALPPGAVARPAVNPRDPSTYDRPRASPRVAPGGAVTPTPLCKACHTLGD